MPVPIAMSKEQWSRIVKRTDHESEDPEVLRRREYVKYLETTSREMTKSWPNSLENVNKRNDELRRERIEAAEKANAEFYKKYLRRKKDEQQRLMSSARETVFINKDAPKMLLSAVIETVTQKERMEQLKFQKEQRRLKLERKKRDDDEIITKAKEWNELIDLKNKRRFEANKQHQKDILEQAHEISERNRIEYETELNLQKIDNIKADEQMATIKEFEDNLKAAEKARIWSDMERSRQEVEARKKEQAARDKMDDKLLDVLLKSRARIDRKRAQTELSVKNEKLRMLEKISQRLESGDAAREAHEQAIRENAIKQREAADEARRQADLEKQRALKKERMESRRRAEELAKEQEHERHVLHQWDVMNRFKNAELFEEFKDNLRKEKERKTQEYRSEILRLWKERTDREAQELADTRYFYGELAEKKIRDDDEKLLSHAAALLHEARRCGRPQHALWRALDNYCRLNRLYPLPRLPAPLARHFPQYEPRAHPLHEPQAQEEHKSPKKISNKIETVEDYKKKGPANGLQRKPSEADLSLPPIAAIPCKTEACNCKLKSEEK